MEDEALPSFGHSRGPVFTAYRDFGERHDGPFDAMMVFGGWSPERMPDDIHGVIAGHIARGDRVLLLAPSSAQLAWAQAQIAILTAAGGRA